MKTFLSITYGVLIGLVAAGIVLYVISIPRGETITLLPTATPGYLTVYVSGAVTSPGVYKLPEDSRVGDAVTSAGGSIPGADLNNINLALMLKDGQQVIIPGNTEISQISIGRVNINTATLDELTDLPGIGPTTAQAIIDYRLQNGSFQDIQDLLNVPGIGPATFAMIQDYITIGP